MGLPEVATLGVRVRDGEACHEVSGRATAKVALVRQKLRELENLTRRLAALYPQETITGTLVEAELGADQGMPDDSAGGAHSASAEAVATAPPAAGDETLSLSVERHMAALFRSYGNDLPPPGLYHRVLRELELPLIAASLAATRGNQIKAAEILGLNRNTLRKKIKDLDIGSLRVMR